MKYSKISCDPGRCAGCLACVVACIDQHAASPADQPPSCRLLVQREDGLGYLTESCRHCADAPCAAACPTGALYQDEETGLVLLKREACVGCRKCAAACPFSVPQYGADGKLVKCDGCWVRVSQGLAPACVNACPMGALSYKEETNEVQ